MRVQPLSSTKAFRTMPVAHKRVLVVLPVSFEVRHRGVGGGVAITYQRLARDLEQRGHQVTVLSTWKTLDGVESFVSGRYRDIASSWHNVKLIDQEIARHDVAVLIGGTSICWIHLLCHRQKLPVVFTHHTAVEKIPVPWWIWWAPGILYGMQMVSIVGIPLRWVSRYITLCGSGWIRVLMQ